MLTAIPLLLETPHKAKNLEVMLFPVVGMFILLVIYVAAARAIFFRGSADR
ncbi:hypothetical protein [Paraburkholderia caledonica]|uniref:hypothetical protein n=1 Tax=Paraburkholderia caledonica TaxID=134536 RepID=UPI0012EBBA7F|nr:hypothetical protein [Paraburkholderia caledonica]